MSPISGEADRAGVRGGGRVLKVSSRSDSFSIFVWARVFREVGGLTDAWDDRVAGFFFLFVCGDAELRTERRDAQHALTPRWFGAH